jgi:hypothetical protein
MLHGSPTYFKPQGQILFFLLRLRHHTVLNFIFQNSIVLIISRFPWLLPAVGNKSRKTFLISYCLQNYVIFKFRFKPPAAPSLLGPPCLRRSTARHKYSRRVGPWEAGTELLYILCCRLLRTVRSRARVSKGLPVCTFRGLTCHHLHPERHTLCQRNGDNATAALCLMHARSGRAVPCGRRSNRRLLVGSSANCFFSFTWSLHNLSTAGFLPWRPRFGARLVHMTFLVYEEANGIVFALIPPKLQSSIVCLSLFTRLSC